MYYVPISNTVIFEHKYDPSGCIRLLWVEPSYLSQTQMGSVIIEGNVHPLTEWQTKCTYYVRALSFNNLIDLISTDYWIAVSTASAGSMSYTEIRIIRGSGHKSWQLFFSSRYVNGSLTYMCLVEALQA